MPMHTHNNTKTRINKKGDNDRRQNLGQREVGVGGGRVGLRWELLSLGWVGSD